MQINLRSIKQSLGKYFNLLNDKEDELAVIEQVRGGIAFRGTNLWILIFAIFIASLGLNVNSTAVIIGAMLISPLMGPIIGMGLSVGISDSEMLKQALKNYGVATLISVLTATLYFFISPLSEARSELLARTSPTLYDVLIAFFGGAAGVLALTTKSKGQVIPGVAIATALMPPLCTAGYGLATAQWSYFFGAFYLFFINTVFIATATFLGVKLLRFHSVQILDQEASRRGRKVMMWVVVVTMIPAAIITVNLVSQDVSQRNVNQFVHAELDQEGTQILSSHMENDTLNVVAIGREIAEGAVAQARHNMKFYGLDGKELLVIQASAGEGFALAASQLSNAEHSNKLLSSQIGDLQRQLAAYTDLDTLSSRLGAEAKVLFRGVEGVTVGSLADGTVAIVRGQLNSSVRTQVEDWLAVRLRDRNHLEVIFKDE
ncbi:MAG: DUF389 domain-containing protein [Bacteroidales bacterium]|nr:DUF389 domain-containing protein [Bacteroidales bacterium]